MNDKLIYGSFPNDPTIPNPEDVPPGCLGFGYTGSQGERGLRGPTGPQGIRGYTGSAGMNGYSFAIVSPTPPGAPVQGTLWYDTTQTQQQLKIYLQSYGWVPVALPSAV